MASVSDDEVVENFMFDMNDERGALRQYLIHGSAVAVIGNTMCVHGAVDVNTMGLIPQHTLFELPTVKIPPAASGLAVPEWVEGMNAYLAAGMADHAARPTWDETRQTRGGESLMALQNRCAMWGRTIVSNCYADGGNITSPQAEAKREESVSTSYGPLPVSFGNILTGCFSRPCDCSGCGERPMRWHTRV